ncbi:MAG: zinc ribbon domain-containing protein [Actinobacteria bacterium]|nr:zinc ribbon domain-containing protein [Actinomycetota bacterium]
MLITCPGCGAQVSATEYFCSVCGKPLFGSGPDAGSGDLSDMGVPPLEEPIRLQGEESFAAPYSAAAPPRHSGYGVVRGEPAPWKKRRTNIRWGWVVAAMIVAAFLGLGFYLAYQLFHVPEINTTAPPGWSDAPELLRDVTMEALEATYNDMELDYLFCKLDDMDLGVEGENIALSSDIIYIAHIKYVLYDDLPDTESFEEMESYIRVKKTLLSAKMGEEITVREMEAIQLACGNVGMYVLASPNGSHASIEELIVKKKNTVYLIAIGQSGVVRFPSEEMEYLAGAITFD